MKGLERFCKSIEYIILFSLVIQEHVFESFPNLDDFLYSWEEFKGYHLWGPRWEPLACERLRLGRPSSHDA
jgi:hypothetical protein